MDLFRDGEFAEWTGTWLKALQAIGSDDPPSEWLEQYRRTLFTAMAHLSDDEIEFFGRSTLLLAAFRDAELCERVARGALAADERARIAQSAKAELPRYFRTLKRIYLAALANQVPRPMPTDDEVRAATLRLLTQLREADRERLLKFITRPESASGAENCASTGVYLAALDATPGDTGRVLRRSFIVALLRAPFDATPASPPASVKGAASGQFQPGSAQLDYPIHAANAHIEGTMQVRIWVDENGRATRVKTIERQFNKPFATLSDGTQLGVDEMFDPVVAVYYRAGRFMQRFKDGKPQAYVVDVPIDWKLE